MSSHRRPQGFEEGPLSSWETDLKATRTGDGRLTSSLLKAEFNRLHRGLLMMLEMFPKVEIEQALEFHHPWDRAGSRCPHDESFDWHKLLAIDWGSWGVSGPRFRWATSTRVEASWMSVVIADSGGSPGAPRVAA